MYISKSSILTRYKNKLKFHIDSVKLLENNFNDLNKLLKLSVNSIKNGGKIIFAGNGGSASQSNHLTAELVNKFKYKGKALSSISLTSNIANITAIANDNDYKYIFSRQIEANATNKDLLIFLTSSNQSKNIIEAIKTSNKMKIKSCLITSKHANKKSSAYFNIILPARDTASYQEIELLFSHFYIEILEYIFK